MTLKPAAEPPTGIGKTEGRRDVNSELRRLEVRYEGRVQGVGFRWTVARLAAGRPVTGYVRNEPDGTVSMVAEGPERDLTEFLDAIAASAVGRHIRNRSLIESPYTGEFRAFEIRY